MTAAQRHDVNRFAIGPTSSGGHRSALSPHGPTRKAVSPASPRRLGPYALFRQLGVGGMGNVDLGVRTEPDETDEVVAVKVMHGELAVDPRKTQMFLDEARIALGITHPNVPPNTARQDTEGLPRPAAFTYAMIGIVLVLIFILAFLR